MVAECFTARRQSKLSRNAEIHAFEACAVDRARSLQALRGKQRVDVCHVHYYRLLIA